MQLRLLSRSDVRTIDRRATEEFGLPSVVLMENAGRGAAAWLAELGIAGPVVICCGKGNNGGDGYVMARHLDRWGYPVRVLVACDAAELKGDAAVNFRILQSSGIPVVRWDLSGSEQKITDPLQDAAWIVDGMLGTGLQGEVKDPMRRALVTLDACPAPKFAIDIPSGLDCDTGEPLGCVVRASYTATFVGIKLGFANPAAPSYTGEVRVVDIGVPSKLLRDYAV